MMIFYLLLTALILVFLAPIVIVVLVAKNTKAKPKKEKVKLTVPVEKTDMKLFQGTAALIIGVVFVVLAGLIFATTAWHTLPNFSKVIVIFVFSVVFFCASQLAGKLFKIKRTSQAFYILASVFLFLTVLAAGYFRLLGDGFTMQEQHRFKVLCAGSLATELALLAGIKQYQDRIYTKACFWGMSVIMFFLLKAFSLGTADSIKAMACYSSLLLIAGEFMSSRAQVMPSYMNAGFHSFAKFHFGFFGGLMVWLAAAEGLFFMLGHLFIGKATASILTTLTLSMMAAAIAVMVLRQKRQYLQILHSITMIIVFHHLGMCIDSALIYQLLSGALLTVIWFFLTKMKNNPLGSLWGDCFYTLMFALDTVFIMLIAFMNWDSMGELLAAFVTIVLLGGLMSYWSKKHSALRPLIPLFLYPVTIAVRGMAVQADIMFLKYDLILFLFLLAIIVWDVSKRDRFSVSMIIVGTITQLLFRITGHDTPQFALLLSGYLFVKSLKAEKSDKEWYEKIGCLYLLAGIFFITEKMTATFLLQMFAVTAVFAVEYVIFNQIRKEVSRNSFWVVTGITILLIDMTAFYLDSSLAWGYMVACLIIFAIFYLMLYRSGRIWAHLIAALSVLPMPLIAAIRYRLTDNQSYGFTAAAIFITGVLARRFVPVITAKGDDCEEGKRVWQCDWFHILSILILLPMTYAANKEWRFAYLLLIALYVLQYAAVEQLRQSAFTTAAALAVLALWLQPFIQYPQLISLELQLIPAVLFIWHLDYVWTDKGSVTKLQTALYCVVLAVLIGDAFRCGHVVDALIAEVVCLLVFVWAHIKKDVIWLRISGMVIVVVALYMTKDFWLSLSWWVYLLAAGLGLILFAAINEIKKQ